MRPRSVIPGRQRWDIAVLLDRPHVAVLLEAILRNSPGIQSVYANPVTGRLLIFHDTTLSAQQIDRLVHEAVPLAVRQTMTGSKAPRSKPSTTLAGIQHGHYHLAPLWAFSGAVTVVVLGRLLLSSALVRLTAVLLATVVAVRRVWRKSTHRHEDSAVLAGSIWRPMLQIVESHKREFYFAAALSVLAQILEVLPGALFSRIDVLLAGGESNGLARRPTGQNDGVVRLGPASVSRQLGLFAGVSTAASIVGASLSSIVDLRWNTLSQSVQNEWRTKTYAHVQRTELRYLEGERTTRLARVLTDDINQLGRFLATSVNSLLRLSTSFVILIPTFLLFTPEIAWIALLPAPIIVWLSFFYQEHAESDRAKSDYGATNEIWMQLNSQLTTDLEASTTIKSFCTEEYEIHRIRLLSESYRQGNRRMATRTATYSTILRACAVVSFAATLVPLGGNVLAGALPFTVFMLLAALPQLIIAQLPGLRDAVDQYQQAVAALERVVDLLDFPVEPVGIGRRLDMAKVGSEIALDEVTFAYPNRPPALHNLSLRIAPRKTTGIVGVTGAGKTTIVKLLLRFYDVAAGRVLIDDLDIRDVQLNDLRNAIGHAAQDPFLFDGTVEDNIKYGNFDAGPEQVVRAARLAAADDFIQTLPRQYNTIIGERGVTLSSGEKQRLSLARTILKNAPILILDEATSAVDNQTEATIQHNLKDFARDRTVIIIAHRLSAIRQADWIYVLDKGGVIAEEGTHRELLARAGMYAAMWSLQIGQANTGSS